MRYAEIFALGGLVVSVALAYKLHDAAGSYRKDVAGASDDLRKENVISEQLMAQVQELHPGLTFAGVDVLSGSQRETQFGPIGSAVLYVFSTNCPHAPENLPLLDSLHARGITVVGIALDAQYRAAIGFARTHHVRFPVLAAAHGDPIDILPRDATPLTAVFIDGRLKDLWLGSLSEGRVDALSAQLRSAR